MGILILSLSAICRLKYLSEHPFVLLIINLSDCFKPCVNILLTFLIFHGFTYPSYSYNSPSIIKSGHLRSYFVPMSFPNTTSYSILLKWTLARIQTSCPSFAKRVARLDIILKSGFLLSTPRIILIVPPPANAFRILNNSDSDDISFIIS